MARNGTAKTYLWCATCRRSFSHADAPNGACPVCAAPMREMSRFAAIARGFMANELTASELETKHRQLIRLIWTRNGMGEQLLPRAGPRHVLQPLRSQGDGAADARGGGGLGALRPAARADGGRGAYRVEFVDEERFVRELEALLRAGGERWAGEGIGSSCR